MSLILRDRTGPIATITLNRPEARNALSRALVAELRAALAELAGGTELALACDIRVAAADAVFGLPEVAVGLFPGAGGVTRLPKLIGAGRARELLFSGRRVPAEEAARIGLVD